ncbi:hypothetical protein ES708_13622 [subsurface metagenome]
MTNAKRKRQGISVDRWIPIVGGCIGIIGYALWIMTMIGCPEPHPPTIQDGIRISRPVVSVGEKVPVRVIVNDPDLPDDEISYFWAAHSGTIGEQLDPFQGPEVVYVAPDLPGTDVIEVMVYDRKGETDRDFYIVTIVETERLGSP